MSSWRYRWGLLNPPAENKEKNPDDKLYNLNPKYFNEFWLLVNGRLLAGMCIQPDGENLVNPAIFWEFLEK